MDEIKLAKVSYQLNQCDRVQCSQGHTSATTVEHLAGLPRRRCESSIAGAGHSEIDGKGAPPAPFPWATGYSAHTGGVLRPRKGGSTPRNPRPLMRNQNMRIECKVNKFRAALSSHPQNHPESTHSATIFNREKSSIQISGRFSQRPKWKATYISALQRGLFNWVRVVAEVDGIPASPNWVTYQCKFGNLFAT